eukprot:6177481-Pleurochrysis_carterae.AAC.1
MRQQHFVTQFEKGTNDGVIVDGGLIACGANGERVRLVGDAVEHLRGGSRAGRPGSEAGEKKGGRGETGEKKGRRGEAGEKKGGREKAGEKKGGRGEA